MTLTKNKFRTNCLTKIRKLPQHNKLYRDALVNKRLEKVLTGRGKRVLFYYPLNFEANIVKTLQKMRKKHSVYLPFMEGESFKMVPFRLPLKKKKFGIFEAGNSLKYIKKIDIAVVPAVGIDSSFQRVGFGKGMYDRFFAKLHRQPFTVFIQPTLCMTREKVCDSYDVACNVVITPTKTLQKPKLVRN